MNRQNAPLILVVFVVPLTTLEGDDRIFEDNFLFEPCASGQWVCQGSAFWVPPPDIVDECDSPAEVDPADPCTLYPEEFAEVFGGYAQLTPPLLGQTGNSFLTQRILWDNFKLTVALEFRDGDTSVGAGGMSIAFVGTETAPKMGGIGAGLGATGLGEVPTMAVTLSPERNEIGLALSDTGFSAGNIPMTVGPVSLPAEFPLNNKELGQFELNRFIVEIFLQGGLLRISIKNDDRGMDQLQLIEYQIPNFVPVHGYLGVTAATGDAWQNCLLHSIKSVELDDLISGADFFRGDADDDGKVNLTDAIAILGYLFRGGDTPGCLDAADLDNDGAVKLNDGVRVLNYLFRGDAPPAFPGAPEFGNCSRDPVVPEDEIDCAEYRSCPADGK